MKRVCAAALIACALAGCRESRPPPDASAVPVDAAASPLDAAPSAPTEQPSPRHADGVLWSPSGRALATWCAGNRCPRYTDGGANKPCAVHLWDLPRARITATLEAPCEHDLVGASWSPAEDRLAIGDYDSLRVWRLSDRAQIAETGSIAMYGAHRFSPDGKRLVWGNVFGTVEILDAGGKVVRRTQLHSGAASLGWSAIWDPTGKWLAVDLEHEAPQLWDGRTGAFRRSLRVPGVSYFGDTSFTWSSDGASVLLVGGGGLVTVADAASGKQKILRRPAPDAGDSLPPMASDVSSDGKVLVLLDGERRLELWDIPSGSHRVLLPPSGEGACSGCAVHLSPDAKRLALVRENALELLAIDAPDRVHALEEGAKAPTFVDWGADGTLYAASERALLAVSPDGSILWRHPLGDPESVVRLSPDRRFAAIVGVDVVLLRLADRRTLTLVADAGDAGATVPALDDAAVAAFFAGQP